MQTRPPWLAKKKAESNDTTMVVSCCAIDCTNRHGTKSGLGFFHFLSAADRRQKWIRAVKRKDWEPGKHVHSRICGEHFVSGEHEILESVRIILTLSTVRDFICMV